MKLQLTRTERTPDGTFGVLELASGELLYTMEDDWLDNRKGVSCIPPGIYQVHRTIFHKHGYETFEVMDVPGRARILVHPANTEEDVEGCIGVGLRRGYVTVPVDEDTGARKVRKRAVVESQAAFRVFMDSLRGVDEATLDIAWLDGVAP